jgi:hypothetical protein
MQGTSMRPNIRKVVFIFLFHDGNMFFCIDPYNCYFLGYNTRHSFFNHKTRHSSLKWKEY